MKKGNIINLIRYHAEDNDRAFRNEANIIANYFDEIGDYKLAEYIMALLSDAGTFVPMLSESDTKYFIKSKINREPLPLPDAIRNDVIGIVNAASHDVGINKFLFQGVPGTGKTETAKYVSTLLKRELYIVDIPSVIDSKLGQTAKNIQDLFNEINELRYPNKVIVLFDEIDAIALDRTNSRDIREMGRATSQVLKGLDSLNSKVILIATTNLFDYVDKALSRRFDSVIDFNRYSREDLIEISEIILDYFLPQFKSLGRNKRLFKKIINEMKDIPYPGDLKNIIKTAMAFSDKNSEYDYLKRLYETTKKNKDTDLKTLRLKGFTVREIAILKEMSKSQVSRELRE